MCLFCCDVVGYYTTFFLFQAVLSMSSVEENVWVFQADNNSSAFSKLPATCVRIFAESRPCLTTTTRLSVYRLVELSVPLPKSYAAGSINSDAIEYILDNVLCPSLYHIIILYNLH